MLLLAALAVAVGLAACGGGDDSSSTTTEAAQTQPESKANQGGSKQSGAKEKGESGSGGEKQSGGSTYSGSSASEFVPQQHSDSGGGSAQFRTNGGDNSIQEFGDEAESSDFDEAAVALHNFLDARAEGNWAAACEYMSNGVVESFQQLSAQSSQVKGAGCAEILGALTNPAAKQVMKAEAAKADARSLRVEGERAFLIYTGLEGTVYMMPMANEDGAWKVAALAGSALS
jgi:hypothetical protein